MLLICIIIVLQMQLKESIMSTTFSIRMDEELKEEAFPVIESYGLTPAQAIKLFLKQIADTKTIPINFEYKAEKEPNEVTRKAMLELLENRHSQKLEEYASLEAMMTALKGE